MYRRRYLNGSFGGMFEFKRRMYVITPFPRPAFVPSPFPDLLSRLVHHLPSCTFLLRLSFFPHHFFRPPPSAFYLRPSSVTFPASVVLASRPQHPASILLFPAFPTAFHLATRDGFPSPLSLPTTASASPPPLFFLSPPLFFLHFLFLTDNRIQNGDP